MPLNNGARFPEYLVRKTEVWSLYSNWHQLLEQKAKFSVDFYDRNNLFSILKIKDLVYNYKDAFFKEFFLSEKLQEQAKKILQSKFSADSNSLLSFLKNKDPAHINPDEIFKEFFLSEKNQAQSSPAEIERKLDQEIEQFKQKINLIEERLLTSAHWIARYGSTAIRFFTHNPYALKADFLVESQDKALQSVGLGQFSTPLEPGYRRFSKILTACGLFTLDLMQWRWIGFSQIMLTSISQQLMPRAEIWIKMFSYLNRDEKATMACLPIISHLFDRATFVGVNSYFYGFNLQSIAHLSITYVLALGTSYICAKAINTLFKTVYKDRPLQDIPTYPFVFGMSQWVVFPLTVTYALPFLFKHFSSLPQNVLVDEKTCFAHKDLCKKEARKVLGLSENSTIQAVKDAYHDLAIKYHPDKNPSGAETFMQITEARNFCLALK